MQRFSISMSDNLIEALARIQADTGQEASETLRKALTLFLWAREQTQSGQQVLGLVPAGTPLSCDVIGLQ